MHLFLKILHCNYYHLYLLVSQFAKILTKTTVDVISKISFIWCRFKEQNVFSMNSISFNFY